MEGHSDKVNQIAINSNGTMFVSASDDGYGIIWKKSIGWNIYNKLRGHNCKVTAVSFSHDEKRIVSGDCNGTIKVWDVETGVCISTFKGKTVEGVKAVTFTKDNMTIRAAFTDGSVQSWEWRPIEDIYDELKKKYKNRNLTEEEKRTLHIED